MSIVLSGGGTLGSITSLLSIAESIRELDSGMRFYFMAPYGSPGKELVLKTGIPWYEFPGGKLRRYASVKNFFEPVNIARAFFMSRKYFKLWQGRVFVSSGSFVSPPLAWQANMLGMKIVLIQLDVLPGLANKLMLPIADAHFVAWEILKTRYPNAIVSGLPLPKFETSASVVSSDSVFSSNSLPNILIIGGGTGAERLNKLVSECKKELTSFCNIIHLTGRGKGDVKKENGYVSMPYLSQDELLPLIKKATLIVSRAGMGALSDAIAFRKPLILIPIKKSHQEINAHFIEERKAAHVLLEKNLNTNSFVRAIRKIIEDKNELARLSEEIGKLSNSSASALIAEHILKLYNEHS